MYMAHRAGSDVKKQQRLIIQKLGCFNQCNLCQAKIMTLVYRSVFVTPACYGSTWECVITSYRHMLDHVCYTTHLLQQQKQKHKDKLKTESADQGIAGMDVEEQEKVSSLDDYTESERWIYYSSLGNG